MLKNITGTFTEEQITNEIVELRISQADVVKVKKLPTQQELTRKHFIVQITSESKFKNLIQITKLCYQKIKWDRLHEPKSMQCTRCQRVGHSASSCGMNYRYVKCSENHPKDECSILETDGESKLTCGNCKGKGHPVNYQGYPYFKFAHEQKQARTNAATRPTQLNNRTRSHLHECIVQPNLSYHQVLLGQEPCAQEPPQPQQPINSLEPPTWAVELQKTVADLAQEMRSINTRMSCVEYNSQ